MTVTAKTFRADFPEFASTPDYPDSVVGYFIAWGTMCLNPRRWGFVSTAPATSPPTTIYDFGLELFVAHHIALEKAAIDASRRGATPGTQSAGPINSKSIGPISVSFDSGSSIEMDAGHWNETVYGRRFIRMARMRGAGGLQVGVGWTPPHTLGAWPGPPPWPGWFG